MGHTLGVVDHAIKVLDVTQAVTAQLQGVGSEAQAVVHDIEGALVLEGVAGVPIRHNDLHHGCSVHDGPHSPSIFVPDTHMDTDRSGLASCDMLTLSERQCCR